MKRETKILVGKIILGTIASAGVLAVAAVAPNALKAIDIFYPQEKRKYHRGYYVKKSVAKLRERGLIKFERKNGMMFTRLTEKGRQELLRYQLKESVIKKPKRWDKKWRVIIFDIKEKRKIVRDQFRMELVNLGFLRLQNSVWVYPYECEEVVVMLKAYFKTGRDILYLTVDEIENDKWLKAEFGLL